MIKIIDITSNPISHIGKAAGLCWGANTEDLERNYKRGLDCLKSNHGRTFEYADVTLEISGYSARVIREVYTHCIGTSRLQESTRYVDCSDFDYYIPDTLKTTEQIEVYTDIMSQIKNAYGKLLELKVPKEDVANILPLGMHTKIVIKINLRALLHMFELRTCTRAYKEYRLLMEEIRQVLSDYDEEWNTLMKDFAKTKCEIVGYCEETYCCGRYKKRQ